MTKVVKDFEVRISEVGDAYPRCGFIPFRFGGGLLKNDPERDGGLCPEFIQNFTNSKRRAPS